MQEIWKYHAAIQRYCSIVLLNYKNDPVLIQEIIFQCVIGAIFFPCSLYRCRAFAGSPGFVRTKICMADKKIHKGKLLKHLRFDFLVE